MPAKVDAEDRRHRLVLAAAELIADEGINALTNAKIANRISGSTTLVTHYFQSKRELILDTYQTMASRSRARVEQAMRESGDPLAACLRALLPLDDPTRLEWRVWLAYQGMSVGDPELTRIWASRAASAVDRITRLMEADISAGRMSSSIDPDMESDRLFALIQGMSFQSIVDQKRWTPAYLRRIVDLELLRLRRTDDSLRAACEAELADASDSAAGPALG
jgi:AcrR family transcriptional regulator